MSILAFFFKENVIFVLVSPILPLLKMQLKSKVHNVSKKKKKLTIK
jgi:hypothetical protein